MLIDIECLICLNYKKPFKRFCRVKNSILELKIDRKMKKYPLDLEISELFEIEIEFSRSRLEIFEIEIRNFRDRDQKMAKISKTFEIEIKPTLPASLHYDVPMKLPSSRASHRSVPTGSTHQSSCSDVAAAPASPAHPGVIGCYVNINPSPWFAVALLPCNNGCTDVALVSIDR